MLLGCPDTWPEYAIYKDLERAGAKRMNPCGATYKRLVKQITSKYET